MKVHAIQTGTVRVKVCQTVGRGRGFMRQVNILLDRPWTDVLPIYAWAVETPEGIVMVDTGETRPEPVSQVTSHAGALTSDWRSSST